MSTREAVVSGAFYPDDAEELRILVEDYLDTAEVSPAPDRVAAIVAPHAGYVYSGVTAGHAFARVRGMRPKRVVVMGRSHRHGFPGVAIPEETAFRTPLGKLPVDVDLAEAIAGEHGRDAAGAHREEHSIEVMLPFIQVAIGKAPIVPLLFGADATQWNIALGRRMAELLGPHDLVVASTDLSHYLTEEEANAIDDVSLRRVLSKDCAALAREIEQGVCSMCGATAVVTAMAYAEGRGATASHLLDYRTSAEASGDYNRVVGYGAISMERMIAG